MRSRITLRAGSSNLFHAAAIGVLLITVTICGAKAAEMTVSDAWIRALPPSVPSGGYFTLHNGGAKAVIPMSAESPACGMLMLHKSENRGGMGGMEDVTGADIPAGGTLRLTPGGYHLMCMHATPAIKPGTTVPVTLAFKAGSSITAKFQVRNAAGK
jgi:copper(I)-binding protein